MLDELHVIHKLTVLGQWSPASSPPPLLPGLDGNLWGLCWDRGALRKGDGMSLLAITIQYNYSTRSVWEGTSGKGEPLLERGYWGRFLKLQYQILYLLHPLCAGHCARAVGTYEPSRSISQVVGLVKTPGSHEQKPNSANQATKINLF